MQPALILALAPLAAFAFPAPSSGVRRVHERRDAIPSSWVPVTDPFPTTPIPLRIALTQSNLDSVHDELMHVSDPSSEHFGKHWTAKEVAEFFAPSKESVDIVLTWLESEGISRSRVEQSQSLGWLEISGVTVAEAESLLDTKYTVYLHDVTGTPHLGCGDYSVPEEVAKHVDFVTPTVHFDTRVKKEQPQRKRSAATEVGKPGSGSLPKQGATLSSESILQELEYCNEEILPICLQALYNIPVNQSRATAKNSYGIVEYTPQSYFATDLDMFFGQFAPQLVGHRPTMDSIDGGNIQTMYESFDYNGESDLDLEYAMTLVYPLNPTLYQTGDMVEGGSFNNFLDALDAMYYTFDGGDDPTEDGVYPDPYGGGYEGPETCGGYAATYVVSTSYGYNEADLTPFYEERQCAEYAKLGLQGVSILYSSGDYGVAGNDGECLTANGTYALNGTRFNPSFPGTCPYVTSVGATQIVPNATVYQPEEACETVIYSDGGFSNVFAMPSYQAKAVSTYYEYFVPPYTAAQYNNSRSVRGFPDVAASGANYVIAIDGEFALVYGTSASSPVFGSIVTLINDARLAAGKGPIGFLNPSMYANPSMFNDITMGSNQGCGTEGFYAVPGWDPVTGLGTPNYLKMVSYYLALP